MLPPPGPLDDSDHGHEIISDISHPTPDTGPKDIPQPLINSLHDMSNPAVELPPLSSSPSVQHSLLKQERTPPGVSGDRHHLSYPPSTPLAVLITPTTSSYTDPDPTDKEGSPRCTPPRDDSRSKRKPVTYAGRRSVRGDPADSHHTTPSLQPRKITSLPYRAPNPDQLRARDSNLAPELVGARSPISSPTTSSSAILPTTPDADDHTGRGAITEPFVSPETPPRRRKRRNATSLGSSYRPKRIALRLVGVDSSSSSSRSIPSSRRLVSSASVSASAPGSASPSVSTPGHASSGKVTHQPISVHNPFKVKLQTGRSSWSLGKMQLGHSPSSTLNGEREANPTGPYGVLLGSERGLKVKQGSTVVKGETILRSDLTFAALHNAMVNTHCWGCHTRWDDEAHREGSKASLCGDRYLRCERCQTALWCSLVSRDPAHRRAITAEMLRNARGAAPRRVPCSQTMPGRSKGASPGYRQSVPRDGWGAGELEQVGVCGADASELNYQATTVGLILIFEAWR